MSILKRFGRFDVTRELIERQPYEFKSILANFLIVRAETRYPDIIQYWAYSDFFDLDDDAEKMGDSEFWPKYGIVITTIDDKIDIEIKREDK